MRKLFFILFLIACGSSSQSGESRLTPAASGFNLPIRVSHLASGKSLVADAGSGELILADFETGERDTLATFDVSDDFSIAINGLLVDREFSENAYVFVYHGNSQSVKNQLTRLELRNEMVVSRQTISILSDAGGHNGGGMYQFENGDILLGSGDHLDPANAQDPNSLAGKLILLNREGEILDPAYASGLRNPFGVSGTDGLLFVIDNGPECDDEINLIRRGANYGWGDDYVCGQDSTALFRWPESLGTTDILFRGGRLFTSRFNEGHITVFNYSDNQLFIERVIPTVDISAPLIDVSLNKAGSILFSSQDGSIYRLE